MSGTSRRHLPEQTRSDVQTPAAAEKGPPAAQPVGVTGSAGSLRSMPGPRPPLLPRVLFAAAVVAAADLLDAIVVWVVIFQKSTVQRICQSIARGLLGPDAYKGGNATAVLGLVLHFIIALGWTLAFLFVLQRWPRLRAWTARTRSAVLVGLVYGAGVWLLMDSFVLPLSRAGAVPPTAPWFWIQLVTHPFVVGLPIALILGRAASSVPTEAQRTFPQPAPGGG